jgi:hypothetical protein
MYREAPVCINGVNRRAVRMWLPDNLGTLVHHLVPRKLFEVLATGVAHPQMGFVCRATREYLV